MGSSWKLARRCLLVTITATSLFCLGVLHAEAATRVPLGYVPFQMRMGTSFDDTLVYFCPLEHEARAADPPSMPMFRDLVAASPCSTKHEALTLTATRAMIQEEGSYLDPTGLVFHQARCGSTLVANSLAVIPEAISYSESAPPADILRHTTWPSQKRAEALRVVMRAMGRVPNKKRMFFKFQSAMTPHLGVVREAFPETPWVYVQRDPVEVMASLLHTAASASRHRTEVGTVSSSSSPCTRSQNDPPGDLLQIIGVANAKSVADVPTEQYCAAHLAYLDDIVLRQLTERGPGGVLNYEDMPEILPSTIEQHFGIALSQPEIDRIQSVASQYSKGRGSHEARPFSGDAAQKQSTAPESLKRWAREYVMPRHDQLIKFKVGTTPPRDKDRRKAEEENARQGGSYVYPKLFSIVEILDRWNPDTIQMPDDPYRYSSLRVFDYTDEEERAEALRFREAEVPFVVRGVTNLMELNARWSDDYLSKIFADNMKPVEEVAGNHFMYYNRGHADIRSGVVKRPTTDRRLTFHDWVQRAKEGERQVRLGLANNEELTHYYFRASARQGARVKLRGSSHDADPGSDNSFIADEMTIFYPEPSLFIKDPDHQHGIHCRFGMAGIIAEAHYDAGRNYIAVVRGRRRYILAPPSACHDLDLLRTGPSARHTKTDWTNPAQYRQTLKNALGMEVILEPGDVLYVPSYWFHVPISLTSNIQCNSRSGSPSEGSKDIESCGFRPIITEGEHVPKKTPFLELERPIPEPSTPPTPAPHDPVWDSARWDAERRAARPISTQHQEVKARPGATASGNHVQGTVAERREAEPPASSSMPILALALGGCATALTVAWRRFRRMAA